MAHYDYREDALIADSLPDLMTYIEGHSYIPETMWKALRVTNPPLSGMIFSPPRRESLGSPEVVTYFRLPGGVLCFSAKPQVCINLPGYCWWTAVGMLITRPDVIRAGALYGPAVFVPTPLGPANQEEILGIMDTIPDFPRRISQDPEVVISPVITDSRKALYIIKKARALQRARK